MRKMIWAFAFLLIAVTCFCDSPPPSLNYRTTVKMETPEGLRTFSVVRKVTSSSETSFFPGQGGTVYFISGQALILDIENRCIVFGLMRDDYSYPRELRIFPEREKTPIGKKAILAPDKYPMFVRFRDLKDPKTVEKVYGRKIYDEEGNYIEKQKILMDRFEEVCGSGVKLKEMSVEIIEAPVTTGITNTLPWLLTMRGTLAGTGGLKMGRQLHQQLDTKQFVMGIERNNR
ncbi:MAG: hypothetical protein ACAH83_14265 [Alphaproteobacteria bacterium]